MKTNVLVTTPLKLLHALIYFTIVYLIFFKVCNPHVSTDGLLRDFCDGEDYKQHPLFGENPHAIVLHCYYDEFQVANPLGSRTKTHKLGIIINSTIFIANLT